MFFINKNWQQLQWKFFNKFYLLLVTVPFGHILTTTLSLLFINYFNFTKSSSFLCFDITHLILLSWWYNLYFEFLPFLTLKHLIHKHHYYADFTWLAFNLVASSQSYFSIRFESWGWIPQTWAHRSASFP